MERATGIEPASEAWEASILPMNYARNSSSRRNRPVDHIVIDDGLATSCPAPRPPACPAGNRSTPAIGATWAGASCR